MSENGRGLGLADLAVAIAESRPHVASGAIALHVVEIMSAVLSAAEGERVLQIPPRDTDYGLLAGEVPGADAPEGPGRAA